MWPDGINPENGTLYMVVGDHKVEVAQIKSVHLDIDKGVVSMRSRPNKKKKLWYQSKFPKYDNKSWRKHLWFVWLEGTAFNGPRRFLNRNAAIMWLKRYGINLMVYRLNGELVCVINSQIYFSSREHGLLITAESKRTHPYAIRNN